MKTKPTLVNVVLTIEEANALRELAHFYDRSLRPVRALVRITSRKEVRHRFQFVTEESRILSEFATATYQEMTDRDEHSREVQFTPRAVVSFWGRALASLDSKRSRRRMSPEQVERREALATKLQEAGQRLAQRDRRLVERELSTRRPVEAAWMRERLHLSVSRS